MIWVLGLLVVVASAYQLIAVAACAGHLFKKRNKAGALFYSGVSILKPVRRLEPGFDEALRSHAAQTYPQFELLLGYQDPGDREAITSALAPYPAARAVLCCQATPNGKVGTLMCLQEQARYPILIVNDADIVVPPNYIRDVTAPLADPNVGLVTCLYRAEGDSWPSRFEALGVATDFAPSALVAPLVGVSEFGFGSTLAFRRGDLEAIGGFGAVSSYLADDYQLGARIHRLGRKNLISHVVVQTRLHALDWGGVWRHQLRWARTIRLSRTGGYIGLPVTFATLWALLAGLAGAWWMALPLLMLRLAMAITAGWFVVGSRDVLRYCWLIPIRDLYGVAVWAAGLAGNTVEWGGAILELDRDGRIIRKTP